MGVRLWDEFGERLEASKTALREHAPHLSVEVFPGKVGEHPHPVATTYCAFDL